jgi:tetratricopeptide (TPR) repeat protein
MSARASTTGPYRISTRPIRQNPDFAEAFDNRGLAYLGKGMVDRAIQDFDEAARLSPRYVQAFNDRGAAYFRKGDYDAALKSFDEALRLDPTYRWPT